MDITFYELYTTPVEKSLPLLLQKIYDSEKKVHIVCQNDQQISLLDDVLWTFSSLAFIPHASKNTSHDFHDQNPIWLASDTTFINKPELIILLQPLNIDLFKSIPTIIYFYDAHLPEAKDFIALKKHYDQNQTAYTQWIQSKTGSWEKRNANSAV